MFSIKGSYANCSICDLLGEPSCILETNCEDDLTKVDVIFVAENPGKNEIKKELPLVGRAGKMFRKYFEKYGINKMNYLLTNCVLCQTLVDGKTGNPTSEVIDICKENAMAIIKDCHPKLIVLMGGSPMEAFGFGKGGITKKHDQFLAGVMENWEEYPTAIIVHPSFVNRQIDTWEPKYEEAMSRISGMLSGKEIKYKAKTASKSMGKGIYRYTIPKKFYTDEYRLVDVQFLNRTSQVLYIFRDKDNKKVYHKESDELICYQAPQGVAARKMVPYDELNQISLRYKDRYGLDPGITYESDVRINSKHAMDYYHFNKGEPKTSLNVMFIDIEVDTGDDRVFPNQKDAAYPINMLTTILNGVRTHYVIDNKTEPIKKDAGIDYKIFANEKEFLRTFIKDFKDMDPDFISGWNLINFDMDYMFNRLKNIGINPSTMSRFSELYVDPSKYICHIPGCVAIDQDYVYKTFTFTKRENYKLDFIADLELDGFKKIQMPLPFNEMYWKMLNKTIEYNIRDTVLLEKLEDKLKHIKLLNELRIICNTSFDSVSSFGQIDSLMVSFLRNKGIASKNGDPHIRKKKYPGAFVFVPTPGVYDYITDFDFASLYPSLMLTYNIGVNSFVMKTADPQLGYYLSHDLEKLPNEIAVVIDPLYENKVVKVTKEQLLKKIKDQNLIHTINGCFFKQQDEEFSAFGSISELLLGSRKEYKNQMFKAIEEKDQDAREFFYTRQLVYKVLANTLYGVVANKAFRFFDLSLASAITLGGQEALKTSIIHGDAYMKHIIEGGEYVEPSPLTLTEMYSDEMPNRSNKYILTGDTDSIFCCFEKSASENLVKDINKWCLDIEHFLNDDKIAEIVKNHNVKEEYNRLKLKNELLISRGLFLAKKRYAIRVMMNEGKEVDEVNFMGVEVKRSDYPSKSKELLVKLSELILKEEKVSLKKILAYVGSQEGEFRKSIDNREKATSRPISWGKKLEDYKLVPQGVKAMMAWNEIMYSVHKTGAKGYMFWVKGIDLELAPEDVRTKYHNFIKKGKKLEVIAIPDEEERLPEYFIVDKKATLAFSFVDRYELLLKPLLQDKVRKEQATILTF